MNTDVLFGLEPLNETVGNYRIRREGSILTIFNGSGKAFGRITLSPSADGQGTLWIKDSLAGEFLYYRKRWRVYPIEKGRVSRMALNVNPVTYLIQRFEKPSKFAAV